MSNSADKTVHREKGWYIPIPDPLDEPVEDFIAGVKRELLELHHAAETGLDRLVGTHKRIPFEVVVGEPFVERDDGRNHGVVLVILRSEKGPYKAITQSGNAPLIGADTVLNEVGYLLAVKDWERQQR